MLLMLENVQVLANLGSGANERSGHRQIVTVMLTNDQASAVQSLQPFVLELIVKTTATTRGRTAMEHRGYQSLLRSPAINRGREPGEAYGGPCAGDKGEDRAGSSVSRPRQNLLGNSGQYIALPILILIIALCMAEELRVLKRSRKNKGTTERSAVSSRNIWQ